MEFYKNSLADVRVQGGLTKVTDTLRNFLQIPVPERSKAIACWDYKFESHRGHGCLSVVGVVSCQVEVSATGRSLVKRSPTGCDVSLCVI